MKKSLLSLIIFLLVSANYLHAQAMTTEMEEFFNRIDGSSLADLEAELDEGLEGLRAFSGIFTVPDSTGIMDYALSGEEEKFDDPFKIDTTVVFKAVRQFDNMGFQQSFENGKTKVKFQKIGDDYWNTVWLEEGIAEEFNPKAIYYKDGTTVTEGIADYPTSFFFEKLWGDIAVIDSIDIDYTINYTAAYDSLVLTKKSKKVKYKDGFIKVKKLDRNFVYITISDQYADRVYINALNAEGKVLNSNSSSNSPTSDDQAGAGIFKILELLEDVQTKLKKKDFKDTDAFKKYLIKKASKLEEAKDKDGVYHQKLYFEGNIESVKVYIETKKISKTVSFTAKNNSGFGDIILMQNKTHNTFLDANAKELFKLEYSPIESLGSRYFQNDSLYYHLNIEEKKLEKLNVFRVWEASNGLAFIQKAKEDGFLAYNAEHELASDIPFDDLYSIDDEYVEGISNKVSYFLNTTGDAKKLEGISEIRELLYNRMAAKSNGKYGFLDNSGEIAIPFEYIEIENFKDGLAVVAKEANKYGLIDTKGKAVIPLKYYGIMSHEQGFVWVATGDGYQLIDPKGEILVTVEGSSYSRTSSGSETTYQFGDKKYDAFGRLLSE